MPFCTWTPHCGCRIRVELVCTARRAEDLEFLTALVMLFTTSGIALHTVRQPVPQTSTRLPRHWLPACRLQAMSASQALGLAQDVDLESLKEDAVAWASQHGLVRCTEHSCSSAGDRRNFLDACSLMHAAWRRCMAWVSVTLLAHWCTLR